MDLLVISHSCLRDINRSVYKTLQNKYDIEVGIVAPKQLPTGDQIVKADPQSPSSPKVFFSDLIGQNPRTYKFSNLDKVLNTIRPKVIFIENDPVSLMALEIGRWKKKNNARLLCLSCENFPIDPWFSFKKSGLKGFFAGVTKWSMMLLSKKYVDHVFTINNDGTQIFTRYKFKSVSKIPLGFNPDFFYPNEEVRNTIRERLKIKRKFVISYIGRISIEKGIEILIRSLYLIKDLDWVFLIDRFEEAGGGYQEELTHLVKEFRLESKIIFFDASHKEIAHYMNASDVIVLPSISSYKWKEQYGRVAPEAMACGKLVIASNSGALPELIQGAGLLFEEKNVSQLATLLRQVISDPDSFEHYSINAAKQALDYFSIDAQAKIIHNQIKPWI